MKVFITGGAGFIGSHIADFLLQRGDQVMVIDNYTTGRRDNLKACTNLQIVEGSITDQLLVQECFTDFKPDCVVHAAASYKDSTNWSQDADTNVVGTVHLVKAAEKMSVKRFIYFQTALCYGLNPIEQPVTLSHLILPGDSSYAISKTAAEQYIRLSKLNYISFRLANAYGPRNFSGPLPIFYHRLTQGKPCFVMDTRRDFIFIDDLVKVVIKAIDGQGDKPIYHIASGRDYAIKELFEAVVKALGIQLSAEVDVKSRVSGDTYTILLDPSVTKKDFSWKVSTPLEIGVEKAVDYYKRHGVSETFTHLKVV